MPETEKRSVHEKFYTWLNKLKRDELIQIAITFSDRMSEKDLQKLFSADMSDDD